MRRPVSWLSWVIMLSLLGVFDLSRQGGGIGVAGEVPSTLPTAEQTPQSTTLRGILRFSPANGEFQFYTTRDEQQGIRGDMAPIYSAAQLDKKFHDKFILQGMNPKDVWFTAELVLDAQGLPTLAKESDGSVEVKGIRGVLNLNLEEGLKVRTPSADLYGVALADLTGYDK